MVTLSRVVALSRGFAEAVARQSLGVSANIHVDIDSHWLCLWI